MSDEAREHFATLGVNPGWREPKTFTRTMAERVVALRPRSVLDFGCHTGRTLRAIQERDPAIALIGVDVNAHAIDVATRSMEAFEGHVGGEEWLEAQEPDSVDVALTVSVIDHIGKPQRALKALAGIAPTLLLLEPWTGREGRVTVTPDGEEANPYCWSWDIPGRLERLGLVVATEPLAVSARKLGPHYRLVTARRA